MAGGLDVPDLVVEAGEDGGEVGMGGAAGLDGGAEVHISWDS